MNSIRRLLPAVIAFLCASPAVAQVATAPNFSGTWRLNPAISVYPKNNTAIAESIVIISSDESIEFRQTLGTGGGATRTYRIDGKERLTDVAHADPVVIRGYSKATWKGATLVVEFHNHLDDPAHPSVVTPEAHATEYWRLSSYGRVLTETFDSSYTEKMILVYDKQ